MTSQKKKGGPDPVDIHVGERLRARRMLLGISQEKLADAVGITFQQVQKYERGTNRISCSRLWQFCKVLEAEVPYFFEHLDKKSKTMASLGLADNDQQGFDHEEDPMTRKETLKLVREYYSIPDPKLRRDLLKMIRSMAATLRGDS